MSNLLKKILRYSVYALIAVFTISRIVVELQQYYREETYSPVSTYASLALVFLALSLIYSNGIVILFRSRMSRLVLILTLYTLVISISFKNPSLSLAKQVIYVVMWGMLYLLGFYLSKEGKAFMQGMHILCFVLLVPVLFLFNFSSQLRNEMIDNMSAIANNVVYYVIVLLPWLLLSGKKWIRTILPILITVVSIFSYKRTIIISSLLIFFLCIGYEFLRDRKNMVRNILIVIVVFVSCSVLLAVANKVSGGVALERFETIQEDEGSGRVERYGTVLDMIVNERNIVNVAFGHGYRMVEIAMGEESQSAHNDFLEVAYDFGLIGLVIYIGLHILLIRRMVVLGRRRSVFFIPYLCSYIIMFMTSIFEHLIIYPTYFLFLTLFWGAVEGMIYNKSHLK